MKKSGVLLLLVIITASLYMQPVKASYGINLIDSYTDDNNSFNLETLHPSAQIVNYSSFGQSVNITQTTWVSSIQFQLEKTGNPTGLAYVRIYNATGTHGVNATATGAALYSSPGLNVSTFGGAPAEIDFNFTNPVQISTGIYVIAFENPTAGTVNGNNYPEIRQDNGAVTHDGNIAYYVNGAWAWTNAADTWFRIYGLIGQPYIYEFSDTYYENGTLCVPPVNVTASGAGYINEFNTSGGKKQYYNPEPEMFYWDIGGGYARYIYSFGSENFTVTVPEDTFYVYQFTIKDHTGKTGMGDCFLEAYRTINGTETLIERMKIYLGNPVPLNLVYGRTYHLKVLFADGSRYDWGYFMAGGTDSINLILKGVTFTDQAQILFNHIHVEATRNAAGNIITVNYLDDRENTVWANVTISVRGGGIAYQAARNNDTYTLNWGGANTTLNYIVVVEGEHTDYGAWGRSFILDATHTYPDPPSLEDIFGEVNADFIPFTICMVSLLTFSVAMREKGLIATMFIASILKFINWASWGYDLLVFGWFISIGVALVARGGSN